MRSAARCGTRRAAPAKSRQRRSSRAPASCCGRTPTGSPIASSTSSAQIQQTNKPLYRAYLISQQLREIYRVAYDEAIELLDAWLTWARRCRLAPFVKLAKTITQQRPGIEAAIRHGLSNARIEQVNTQLRLITRRAYGFHTPEALIALAMLTLGDLCPQLPQ